MDSTVGLVTRRDVGCMVLPIVVDGPLTSIASLRFICLLVSYPADAFASLLRCLRCMCSQRIFISCSAGESTTWPTLLLAAIWWLLGCDSPFLKLKEFSCCFSFIL